MTPQPSPEVLQALDTLERATSPADLGPPYQILLDWRRKNNTSVFMLNAQPIIAVLALFALAALLLVVAELIRFEVSPFWRGVVLAGLLAHSIERLFFDRPKEPSIGARIEAAIDRWRSMAPAMREIPK